MVTYGGIELGGTKCVCAVGDGSDDGWVDTVIPTTDPETTTRLAVDWFRDVRTKSGVLVSLGIASSAPSIWRPALLPRQRRRPRGGVGRFSRSSSTPSAYQRILTPTSMRPRSRSKRGVPPRGALTCCTSPSARGSASGRSSTGHWSTGARIPRQGICAFPSTPSTVSPVFPSRRGPGTAPSTAIVGKVWHRAQPERNVRHSGHRPQWSLPTGSCWRASTSHSGL